MSSPPKKLSDKLMLQERRMDGDGNPTEYYSVHIDAVRTLEAELAEAQEMARACKAGNGNRDIVINAQKEEIARLEAELAKWQEAKGYTFNGMTARELAEKHDALVGALAEACADRDKAQTHYAKFRVSTLDNILDLESESAAWQAEAERQAEVTKRAGELLAEVTRERDVALRNIIAVKRNARVYALQDALLAVNDVDTRETALHLAAIQALIDADSAGTK